jgi:hypothetical protein
MCGKVFVLGSKGPIYWPEINSVTEQPGVYAWYYGPRFTKFDRGALEEQLLHAPDPKCIEVFLTKRLFRYFEETPYEAIIQGPLKATYSGDLIENRSITSALSQRLAEMADRRTALWDALESMVPFFAAPLYIGMAKNLRTRLRTHKHLIEGGLEKLRLNTRPDVTSKRDAGFAMEVLRRQLAIERLSVYVHELPAAAADSAVDVENLLNRINYPVLGRN